MEKIDIDDMFRKFIFAFVDFNGLRISEVGDDIFRIENLPRKYGSFDNRLFTFSEDVYSKNPSLIYLAPGTEFVERVIFDICFRKGLVTKRKIKPLKRKKPEIRELFPNKPVYPRRLGLCIPSFAICFNFHVQVKSVFEKHLYITVPIDAKTGEYIEFLADNPEKYPFEETLYSLKSERDEIEDLWEIAKKYLRKRLKNDIAEFLRFIDTERHKEIKRLKKYMKMEFKKLESAEIKIENKITELKEIINRSSTDKIKEKRKTRLRKLVAEYNRLKKKNSEKKEKILENVNKEIENIEKSFEKSIIADLTGITLIEFETYLDEYMVYDDDRYRVVRIRYNPYTGVTEIEETQGSS